MDTRQTVAGLFSPFSTSLLKYPPSENLLYIYYFPMFFLYFTTHISPNFIKATLFLFHIHTCVRARAHTHTHVCTTVKLSFPFPIAANSYLGFIGNDLNFGDLIRNITTIPWLGPHHLPSPGPPPPRHCARVLGWPAGCEAELKYRFFPRLPSFSSRTCH